MQALKQTSPFQLPPNHRPYPLPTTKSQSKSKLQQFKTQIRNTQLHNIKKRCRQELIITHQIDSLLNTLPANWDESLQWSSDFMRLYNEVKSMNLDSHQIVSIFFLAQKFPNRLTLQLLEIIVIRANGESLEILFQYDVMRLLHSAIVYDDTRGKGVRLNRSCSSEESEAIVRQAVVDKVSTAIARIDLKSDQISEHDIFEMARSSVSIIGQLCKKSTAARNFAVINHKTYVYCLKAYKKYNIDIRSQFFRFLKAVTNIEFKRYEDQFERIKAKILNLMFKECWKVEYVDETRNCSEMLYCMKMLLLAAKNLIAMGDLWTVEKIQQAEKRHNYTLYAVAANVIRDISGLLHHMKEMAEEVAGLLSAAIELVMHYEDCPLLANKTATSNSRYFSLKQQMSFIYNDLVYILHRSINIPTLQSMRKMIYFVVNNHLVDTQISESIRYSLLQTHHNNCHIKLLHLMNDLLATQYAPAAFYELAYVVYSVFKIVPLSIVSGYVFESEIIQGVCGRIVQNLSIECKQSMGKLMLVRSLLVLMQRLTHEGSALLKGIKSIIMHQYGHRFNTILTRHSCEDKLSQTIELLMRQFQGEEWVES